MAGDGRLPSWQFRRRVHGAAWTSGAAITGVELSLDAGVTWKKRSFSESTKKMHGDFGSSIGALLINLAGKHSSCEPLIRLGGRSLWCKIPTVVHT